MYKLNEMIDIIKNNDKKLKIVLPEGNDEKIQQVAEYLVKENIAIPVLILKDKKDYVSNSKIEIVEITNEKINFFSNKLFDLRKGKIKSIEDAKKLVSMPNYFATMMLYEDEVNCMLCGLNYTTADTLRPALQIIKTKVNTSIACSVLIMQKGEEQYLFSDCGLNIKPDSHQLADIAKSCVDFGRKLNIDKPQVALLSYSTNGSGIGEDVERVRSAKQLLDDEKVDFAYDGEIQFDAAFSKNVRNKKYKNSYITDESANIFIFPDLNSGNIGYKIAQRMGGFEAIGPIILGLNKPVNDLSRGATFEDIKGTAILTLFQAL